MEIRKARLNDLQHLTPLFDGYRQWYGQEAALEAAGQFLEERLLNGESVIFMAYVEGVGAGFTQLYPVFSSVTMERLWLLNDLYVDKKFRRMGIGEGLLKAAQAFATETRAKGLTLETQVSNLSAQRLYDSTGFKKEEDFYHYFWKA
ncbi:MAG: GNAT family N-acetyltransferase [Imperialibacter sp.]|uniref:GNAT family N-acetyltransferase n=1 Tax=Imperialibacter sp. TaxID=2038411 RepID=UPI003A858E40